MHQIFNIIYSLMEHKGHLGEAEEVLQPQAAAGISADRALEAQWKELTEQHWEMLFFWTRAWGAKHASAQAFDPEEQLRQFLLIYWHRIKADGQWANPLSGQALVSALQQYLISQ